MSVPRPTTAPLGRFAPGELGSGPYLQFQVSSFEADDYRHNPNTRPGFSPGQTQRPQSYHSQMHQEALSHPNVHHQPPGAAAPTRATVGSSGTGQGGSGIGQHNRTGPRVSPIIVQNPPIPVTRYVCFQKKPNKNIWKNEWETCDHITMSIGPEETQKQIRRHDEPGKDLPASISRLGKYQQRHLRKHEDKLNTSGKDSKNWKWVVSAVGKEKKTGGSSQTFWAIYSREPKFRPTNTPGRPPTRSQTFPHPNEATSRHEDPAYDGPIVVQSVEIPAPPRPSSYSQARPATAGGYTSGQYFQNGFMPEVFPGPAPIQPTASKFGPLPGSHAPFPQFSGPGPQIREVNPGPVRPASFSQFQGLGHPADSFPRSANRAHPAVEAQSFGYQKPHSAEPRHPALHRPQSNRVDQPFQPESKRSPRRTDARPAAKQFQRAGPPPKQDQRRRRSSSMAAPRVRQERPESYHDHVDTRKNRRSTLDLPQYPEDKMNRTDRWVESSISGSSGLGTSTVGSGDGGSVVGEYVLNPPPMGKRRNSISTYTGKDYYTNSSAGGLTRGRSTNEGARQRRSAAGDYYIDSRPTAPARRATQDFDLQYAANPRGRPAPKYVGYHDVSRRRSMSRKRSRSRHWGGREGRGSDSEDYEYESADEMMDVMRNLRINSSTSRRAPSRPPSQYRRYPELVEFR